MVDCNCGGYGKPIEGPYHSYHCALTKSLQNDPEDDQYYYVTIPEHEFKIGLRADRKVSPWPTRELAEGAMHRLIHAYYETPVLLWHGDIVIDMKIRADPLGHAYRVKHGWLRDVRTGEKIPAREIDIPTSTDDNFKAFETAYALRKSDSSS